MSERPEWSDVTPLPQEEPSVPVVSIRYSNEDREGLEMLRAVMHAEELSKRALALTKEVRPFTLVIFFPELKHPHCQSMIAYILNYWISQPKNYTLNVAEIV